MPRKDGAKPLSDRIRVQHMLDAALECTTFITGVRAKTLTATR